MFKQPTGTPSAHPPTPIGNLLWIHGTAGSSADTGRAATFSRLRPLFTCQRAKSASCAAPYTTTFRLSRPPSPPRSGTGFCPSFPGQSYIIGPIRRPPPSTRHPCRSYKYAGRRATTVGADRTSPKGIVAPASTCVTGTVADRRPSVGDGSSGLTGICEEARSWASGRAHASAFWQGWAF